VRSADHLLQSSLPPSVQLVAPEDGLPHLIVSTRAATAQVFFHGAHLGQWTPAGAGAPMLWLSARSNFRDDKAIRGGVPICFPWFGAHRSDPAAPAHGFARLVDWTLTDAVEAADGTVVLTLVRDVTPGTSPLWPHHCRAMLRLSIGTTLAMTLDVENRGDEPFAFEEALHTYFAVSEIEHVSITGLEQTEYLDKVDGFARKRQPNEPIRFNGETDRVYLETTATCRIVDPGWPRTIVVSKSGSRSTVVWNPWAERARTFADFTADEWRRMVCVETANVRESAIRLASGASHRMHAEISVEESESRASRRSNTQSLK
jgi:glucose-6-phosphate 1-epimerase